MNYGWIDFHAHLSNRPGAARELLDAMDCLGIARAVVVPGGSLSPEALAEGISSAGTERNIPIDNDSLMANVARIPGGRLIPFYFGNPHLEPSAYLRCAAARGLKLGPAVHGVPLLDPRNLMWVAAAESRNHVVYLHCLGHTGFDIPELKELATRFADTRFVLGHAGVGNADFRAVSMIADQPNIHFETSGGFSSVIRFAVERLGAHRVLFGSEYPMQDPAAETRKTERLAIDASALARLTRLNALELLGDAHA